MTKTITITFENLELEVTGEYQKEIPSSNEYPGDPEAFLVESVSLCGNNISHITMHGFEDRVQNFINEDLQSYI